LIVIGERDHLSKELAELKELSAKEKGELQKEITVLKSNAVQFEKDVNGLIHTNSELTASLEDLRPKYNVLADEKEELNGVLKTLQEAHTALESDHAAWWPQTRDWLMTTRT
jgi:chromosome segregation ATPase